MKKQPAAPPDAAEPLQSLAEEQLVRRDRTLRMLIRANQALVRAPSEPELLNDICRIVVEDGGYRMAWVGYAEQDEKKNVRPVAQAGFEEGYLDTVNITWANVERGRGPTGIAIRTGNATLARNIPGDPNYGPLREAAIQRGYMSSIALPLIGDGKTTGALNIYAAEANAFDAEEVQLLTELAGDLAYSIASLRTRAAYARAEEMLRQSEEKYRMLVEAADDVILLTDLNGRHLYRNSAYHTSLGFPVGADIELDGYARVHPDDLAIMKDATAQLLETGMATSEYRVRHRDEHWVYRQAKTVALYDSERKPEAFLSIIRDITERKRAEAALRALSSRQEAILAAVPDIIMEVDNNKVYTWANQPGFEFFGKDVIGKEAAFYFEGEQDTYGVVHPLFNGAENMIYVESWQPRKDGQRRLLAWWCRVLKDESGNVTGALSSARDITEGKRTEEALRDSEERFRAIASNTPDHILMQDRQLRYTFVVNPQLDLTEQAMIGKTDHDFLPKEEADQLTQVKTRVLETGQPVHFETSFISKVGEAEFFDGSYIPKCDSTGRVDGLIGYFRNITERKRAEEMLQKSELKYRNLIMHAPDIIFVVDAEGNLLHVNLAAQKMLGYTEDELCKMKTVDTYSTDEITVGSRRLIEMRAMRAGETMHFERFMRRKDGTLFPVEINVGALEDGNTHAIIRDITERKRAEEKVQGLARFPSENPNPVLRLGRDGTILYANSASRLLLQDWGCAVGDRAPLFWQQTVSEALASQTNRTIDIACGDFTFSLFVAPIVEADYVNVYGRDITERKRAEVALRQSEERLKFALDGSNDGLWDVQMDTGAVYLSPRGCEILGYRPEELPKIVKVWSELVHPDDLPATNAALNAYLEGKSPLFQVEQRLKMASGERKWVLARGKVVERDPGGAPTRMVGTHTDITERKRAEDEIRKLNATLEQRVAERTAQLQSANKELESFSYSVSHDLRAPLRAISGFAAIIARRHRASLNEEGRHYFDNIVHAGERMGRLIDDLQTYSRLGRAGVRREPVSLAGVFADIAKDLKGHIDALHGTISIAEDLPDVTGDITLLRQIFTNLLENAVTYHKAEVPPKVEVTYQIEGDHVIVKVRDNGIGIPAEHHEKIFNIFQRLHSEDDYPGIGIGLTTVKKSVELLDGSVWVESVVGEGSAFFVKLPKGKS